MQKVILKTVLGLILSLAGFFIAYLYVYDFEGFESPSYFILSVPAMIFGIILLFQAGTSEEFVLIGKIKKSFSMIRKGNILERNNKIVGEWRASLEKRDKMRLLKAVFQEEEKKK